MGAKVNANVIWADPVTGDRVVLMAGDTPTPAQRKLLGDHLFDGRHPAPPAAQGSDVVVPPRSGAGSGADAWAAYAATVGVDVADDASREDIITALTGAGKPVEKPAE